VRVLDRLLRRAQRLSGFTAYHRHRKRAKRRVLEIAHCAPQATTRRARASRALLQDTEATTAYATCALAQLETSAATPAIDRLRRALQTVLPRVAAVIDQTTRRIVHHESVPATEKLVSLFEAHTDVIVKDRRTTHYGHKIFLTSGRSGLILDCAIPAGNPADATWAVPLVRRHARRFGVEAKQVSMDGGFASRENLTAIKTRRHRRLLRQEAWTGRGRHDTQPLDLRHAPPLSRRH